VGGSLRDCVREAEKKKVRSERMRVRKISLYIKTLGAIL
jgi:hypothetical protein